MKKSLVSALGFFVLSAAVFLALFAVPGSGAKPTRPIPLKAVFIPIVEPMTGNHLENIQNGVGALPVGEYAFWHMGEGTRDVHVRILEPGQYGPLQIYIPIESGFSVNVLFDWPPVAWVEPNQARCGWPPFFVTTSGTSAITPKIFSMQTKNVLVESTDPDTNILDLKDTGAYLDFSTMGINGNPARAMVQSTIHIWDNDKREFWLGSWVPVMVDATVSNGRPTEWTITPLDKSYPSWPYPGARELGAPLINRKAEGSNWWCAFGSWTTPFILKLARMN